MKILCKYLGGSHSYGLNTAASDEDIRSVFIADNILDIFERDRHSFIDNRNPDKNKDEFSAELRKYLAGLEKGNTQDIEILFLDSKQFIELDPIFKTVVIDNKQKLFSGERLYSVLRGYSQGEYRLAIGERTGDLGSKRKQAIEAYGFSPKNFSHLFRLLYSGIYFYNEGIFPTNIVQHTPEIGKLLLDIKQNPTAYSKDELTKKYLQLDAELTLAFQRDLAGSKQRFKVDLVYRETIYTALYKPILTSLCP